MNIITVKIPQLPSYFLSTWTKLKKSDGLTIDLTRESNVIGS